MPRLGGRASQKKDEKSEKLFHGYTISQKYGFVNIFMHKNTVKRNGEIKEKERIQPLLFFYLKIIS